MLGWWWCSTSPWTLNESFKEQKSVLSTSWTDVLQSRLHYDYVGTYPWNFKQSFTIAKVSAFCILGLFCLFVCFAMTIMFRWWCSTYSWICFLTKFQNSRLSLHFGLLFCNLSCGDREELCFCVFSVQSSTLCKNLNLVGGHSLWTICAW